MSQQSKAPRFLSVVALLLITQLAIFARPVYAENSPNGQFRAGVAEVDVNPLQYPVRVNGMVEEREATSAADTLMSRALVLDDGKVRLAIVVVDNLMLPRKLLDEVKQIASQQTKIPSDRILISATHTHSAPSAMACLGSRVDPAYAEFLPGRIVSSIVEAEKRLQPARAGWTVVTDEKHNHCRRWIFRPDRMMTDPFGVVSVRAHMHPGYQSTNHIGPSGPADTDLSLLSIQTRDGKPLAVLANYAMHYFGSPLISGDFCGRFGRALAKQIGLTEQGGFVGMMSQGTSGDSMWMDYSQAPWGGNLDTYTTEVAKAAFDGYQKIEYRTDITLAMAEAKLTLNRRVPDEARLKWGRELAAKVGDRLPRGWSEVYAFEAIDLHNNPTAELKLQAIRIGDLGITAIPDEVYGITGLKLKGRSPLQPTFNIELANGAEGYIPPPEQHKLGGYTTWPAKTAGLEVEAEPQIVETLLSLLEKVADKPRRVLADPVTPYSKAVETLKPTAYWRLGEIDRNTGYDSSGKHNGQYEDGVARYLPGAEGPGLAQAPRGSRAAHFAGGRMAVQVPKIGPSYSIAGWFWNGLPHDARAVTGYLFSRGPDGDQKSPGDHIGIGGSYEGGAWQGKLIVFNGNEKDQVLGGSSLIEFRKWHHLVFTRDVDTVRVYLDGRTAPELEGQLPATFEESDQFFLGGRGDGMFGLEGKLDEVALFNRALTGDEATALYLASGNPVAAAPVPQPDSPALSPAESMKVTHVREGFELQLVAAEPLVLDPVAIDWGIDGKLWVAEMADYPNGMDDKGKPGGRVRFLEDTDGDGRYDKSTLFLDGISFPNGVMAWGAGVLVTAAPEIFYAEDTSGDGKADVRTPLYSGFLEGNQQLRVNGLRWGLDNWVYCASGSHHSGYGADNQITSHRTGEKIGVGSRDFRIRPDQGLIEPQSGPSQFGRNPDDWGEWFGVQNSYPLWHYVLKDHDIRRNPNFAPPDPRIQVVTPANPRVYSAAKPEKRFHSFEQTGRFTSACSAMIYRDDLLFPRSDDAPARQHAFTCEPFSNLVQHNVIIDDGVSFRFERDPAEAQLDFFTSEDRWCRPVMARTGPDGALWIVDMYRYMIEHPHWLPIEGQNELRPFFRSGEDKGRIYRIVPKGQSARPVPLLAGMSTPQLVEQLESSSGWLRDAAQRLLVTSGDKAAIEPLKKLVVTSPTSRTRMQALCTLDGLSALTPELIHQGLADAHPGVRRHAVRLASSVQGVDTAKLVALVNDPDAKVRLEVATALGNLDSTATGPALAQLIVHDRQDPFLVAAAMSSLNAGNIRSTMSGVIEAIDADSTGVAELVAGQLAALGDDAAISETLKSLSQREPASSLAVRTVALASLLDGLTKRHREIGDSDKPALAAAIQNARAAVGNVDVPDSVRAASIRLLMREPDQVAADLKLCGDLLTPRTAAPIQQAIIDQLARQSSVECAAVMLQGWRGHAPGLRSQILSSIASRKPWIKVLTEQLEAGHVAPGEIDAALRQRLFTTADPDVQPRLQKLLAQSVSADRKEVLAAHQPVLGLMGNADRGGLLFVKKCAICHKVGEQGHAVGPNLASLTNRNPDAMLLAILDPSAAIEGKYLSYVLQTDAGRVLSGMLATETATHITLLAAEAKTESVLRNEIEELKSTGKSLMPEGLEKDLTHQDLADLIEFVRRLK